MFTFKQLLDITNILARKFDAMSHIFSLWDVTSLLKIKKSMYIQVEIVENCSIIIKIKT